MSVNATAEESGEGLPPPGYVRVEQSDLIPPKAPDRDYKLYSYRERRTKWGSVIGIGYSSFIPTNFEPIASGGYSDVYGSPTSPLLELEYTLKRNLGIGSIGAELGVGYFDVKASDATIGSELQLYQFRIGATFIADMLFSEPWVAPYISGGAYVMNYKETLSSASNNGNTQVAPYFTLGIQFELDWLDRKASMESYEYSGMQATHAFLEVRKYFSSNAKGDPDFETGPQLGGGLRIEF